MDKQKNNGGLASKERRRFFGQVAAGVAAAAALADQASAGSLVADIFATPTVTASAMTGAAQSAHAISMEASYCMGQLQMMQSGAAPFVAAQATQLQGHVLQCLGSLPQQLAILNANPGMARQVVQKLGAGNAELAANLQAIMHDPRKFMDRFRQQAEEMRADAAQGQAQHDEELGREWVNTLHGPSTSQRMRD